MSINIEEVIKRIKRIDTEIHDLQHERSDLFAKHSEAIAEYQWQQQIKLSKESGKHLIYIPKPTDEQRSSDVAIIRVTDEYPLSLEFCSDLSGEDEETHRHMMSYWALQLKSQSEWKAGAIFAIVYRDPDVEDADVAPLLEGRRLLDGSVIIRTQAGEYGTPIATIEKGIIKVTSRFSASTRPVVKRSLQYELKNADIALTEKSNGFVYIVNESVFQRQIIKVASITSKPEPEKPAVISDESKAILQTMVVVHPSEKPRPDWVHVANIHGKDDRLSVLLKCQAQLDDVVATMNQRLPESNQVKAESLLGTIKRVVNDHSKLRAGDALYIDMNRSGTKGDLLKTLDDQLAFLKA